MVETFACQCWESESVLHGQFSLIYGNLAKLSLMSVGKRDCRSSIPTAVLPSLLSAPPFCLHRLETNGVVLALTTFSPSLSPAHPWLLRNSEHTQIHTHSLQKGFFAQNISIIKELRERNLKGDASWVVNTADLVN